MSQMNWMMDVAGLVAAGVAVVALAVRSAETRKGAGGRQDGTWMDSRLGAIVMRAREATMRSEREDL